MITLLSLQPERMKYLAEADTTKIRLPQHSDLQFYSEKSGFLSEFQKFHPKKMNFNISWIS